MQAKRPAGLVQRLSRQVLLITLLLFILLALSQVISTIILYNQVNLGDKKAELNDSAANLLAAMVDQETGVRGYVNSGNTELLETYTTGRPQYQVTLKQLKDRLAAEGFNNSLAAVSPVETRAEDWYQNFAMAQVRLVQSGRIDEARNRSASGKVIFDSFRSAITPNY